MTFTTSSSSLADGGTGPSPPPGSPPPGRRAGRRVLRGIMRPKAGGCRDRALRGFRQHQRRGVAQRALERLVPVHALADMLVLFLPVALAVSGGRLSLGADMLALLAAAAVIALAGGLMPALAWAGVTALLLWFLDMPRHGSLTIAGIADAAVTVVLTVVALAISVLG